MGRQKRWLILFYLFGFLLFAHTPVRAEDAATARALSVPVSTAHTLFGAQCDLCHEPLRGVSEKLCENCHKAPTHNEAQTFTPQCWSCHPEHRKKERLVSVANEQCTTCHADLRVKNNGVTRFAKEVTDFVRHHPEFAFTAGEKTHPERIRLDTTGAREADHAKITFPHDKHLLKPCLKDQKDKPSAPCLKVPKDAKEAKQLTCKDCHAPTENGKNLIPITYTARCQQCHPLTFDPQFPDRVVPHGSPQLTRAFLFLTFSERRGSPSAKAPARSGRLTRPVPSVSPINPSPGVAQRVAAAERYLYDIACDKCHIVEKGRAPFPRVALPVISSPWLPHARFAHKSHRMLECTACHPDAPKSKKATDVLLPGIQLCRECHRADQENVAAKQTTASTNCASCHQYHGKKQENGWNGPFSIQQVLTEGTPRKAKPAGTPAKAQP